MRWRNMLRICLILFIMGATYWLMWWSFNYRNSVQQHLDQIDKEVYQIGFEAGSQGIPDTACPYGSTFRQEDLRKEWLKGWIAAKMKK